MPRAARVVIPNYPHRIIQRGHNREVVFAADEDYHYYLERTRNFHFFYAEIQPLCLCASVPLCLLLT